MREERKMILTMLQEGKITADEAQDLLEALALNQDTSKDRASEQWAEMREKVEQGIEQAREQIEERLKEVRVRVDAARDKWRSGEDYPIEGLEDVFVTVERGLSQFAKELPNVISRVVTFDFGQWTGIPIEQTYEGIFAEHVAAPTAFVSTRNGSVTWETWDEPGYKVAVTHKVRAENEEAAQTRADRATRWETTDSGFRLTAGEERGVTTNVHVTVPRHVRLHVETTTRNGTIRVQDLLVKAGRFTTANGNIRLKEIDAHELHATTVNGSVRVSGVITDLPDTVAGGDETGAMRGAAGSTPQDANWQLNTTNGSIRIRLPHEGDVGYRFDLKTVNGRVRVELPDTEVATADFTRRSARWESPRYDEKTRRVNVYARTVNGSIGLSADDDEEV